MAELFHECGVAAVYHLNTGEVSPLVPGGMARNTAKLIPALLQEIQNRGQLAAGISWYDPENTQLLSTYKDIGTVTDAFHVNNAEEYKKLMGTFNGPAAIGHVRYATTGAADRCNAQPFERTHLEKHKWFSFGFNGQLANMDDLRHEILQSKDFHLSRNTDTEILLHLISQLIAGDRRPTLPELLKTLSERLDGAYNIVFLNARGEMFASRDPLGIRPLCYAFDGALFACASESVALANMGFSADQIRNVPPGHAVIIADNKLEVVQYAESPRKAHCFFEWIYFANVASVLDERSVYLSRKRLGVELALQETLHKTGERDDIIVVPVPDTARGAADGMAFELGLPCMEGLIRNRYAGRTFIEGAEVRRSKARAKYTPLPEVLRGKRVLLIEDTIVRSTTMRVLVSQLRERGGAKEVHVRVACPPIVAPCYYGIDMSSVSQLFAWQHLQGAKLTPEIEAKMALDLEADSLRYLSYDALARSIDLPASSLCQACVDTKYPTACGQQSYQINLDEALATTHSGHSLVKV